MELFRIALKKNSTSLISSGKSNRWNHDKQFVIYTGSSRSLVTLEMIVNRSFIQPNTDYQIIIISVNYDKTMEQEVLISDLPKNWFSKRAYHEMQKTGSEWYKKQEKLLLKVPSAVIPQEYNYVINSIHPDFKKKVKLVWQEDYFWDKRLLIK